MSAGEVRSRLREVAGRLRDLWSFEGRNRVLHLTWIAFFLTFVVWFNFAPLVGSIGDSVGLDRDQLAALAIANVALTVPARVLIGMALDRWGPRRVYAGVLMYAAVPSLAFATATSFELLLASRLALSVVGAGFVVGIRMVAEWFPPQRIGLPEGLYGGFGNFGSAAAAFTLPTVAALAGGEAGWRVAIGATGLIAFGYGLFYLRAVSDTPDGGDHARPERQGALEVTGRPAVFGLLALHVPLLGILGLLAWELAGVGVLTRRGVVVVAVVLAVVFAVQARTTVTVNRTALAGGYPPRDRYPFRAVAILCLAYLVTFGSELAVVSMLPAFVGDTFGLPEAVAGAVAGSFAVTNLVARPAGGLLSDLFGSRRRTLLVLLVGLVVGYALLSRMDAGWPVGVALVAITACSFFVQAGEGAVYAIVPLVKRRVTGQISGLVGAYGGVGAVAFLTLLAAVGARTFFLVMAASAGIGAVCCRWLPDLEEHALEEHVGEGRIAAVASGAVPVTTGSRP